MNFLKTDDKLGRWTSEDGLQFKGKLAEKTAMTWILRSGAKQLKVRRRRVIGRSDFPDLSVLSRQHFEIFEKSGDLYIMDLGSRNGTMVAGKPLEANKPVLLPLGQTIRVGSVLLEVTESDPLDVLWVDAAVLFLLLLAKLGLDKSAAFGKALGFYGLAIVIVLLFISVAIAATVSKIFVNPDDGDRWDYAKYAAFALLGSLGINILLWLFVNSHFGAQELLSQAKIEYHCLAHFHQERCVVEVFRCPSCAQSIEKWKRDAMVEKLRQSERLPSSSSVK